MASAPQAFEVESHQEQPGLDIPTERLSPEVLATETSVAEQRSEPAIPTDELSPLPTAQSDEIIPEQASVAPEIAPAPVNVYAQPPEGSPFEDIFEIAQEEQRIEEINLLLGQEPTAPTIELRPSSTEHLHPAETRPVIKHAVDEKYEREAVDKKQGPPPIPEVKLAPPIAPAREQKIFTTCRYCGNNFLAGSFYCDECGAPVSEAPPPEATPIDPNLVVSSEDSETLQPSIAQQKEQVASEAIADKGAETKPLPEIALRLVQEPTGQSPIRFPRQPLRKDAQSQEHLPPAGKRQLRREVNIAPSRPPSVAESQDAGSITNRSISPGPPQTQPPEIPLSPSAPPPTEPIPSPPSPPRQRQIAAREIPLGIASQASARGRPFLRAIAYLLLLSLILAVVTLSLYLYWPAFRSQAEPYLGRFFNPIASRLGKTVDTGASRVASFALEIRENKIVSDSQNQFKISGAVRNISNETYRDLRVEMELFRRGDKEKTDIRIIPVQPAELAPGATGYYAIWEPAKEYESVKFLRISREDGTEIKTKYLGLAEARSKRSGQSQ